MSLRVLAVAVALVAAAGCAPTVGLATSAGPTAGGQVPRYEREAFGDGWADLDRDCQDTRNEVLIRDLVDEQLDAEGCKVLSGTLHDPYTGKTIAFRRGQTTSDDVQIDHVIPLAAAWRAGAWQWTGEQRAEFANDPAELLAVDGPTNNAKRDRGPSRWLPPDAAEHCDYAQAWRQLATSYALSLDQVDLDTIQRQLDAC